MSRRAAILTVTLLERCRQTRDSSRIGVKRPVNKGARVMAVERRNCQ